MTAPLHSSSAAARGSAPTAPTVAKSLSGRRIVPYLIAGLVAGAPSAGGAAGDTAASALPAIDAGTSLLVVAPHPDDETLCCAGAIQRVLRAGGRVSVVWITSGDASRVTLLLVGHELLPSAQAARALGLQRMAEAQAAVTRLGVPPAGQLFLGYPDRGLPALLGAHRRVPYTSPLTGVAAVPYGSALFPGHRYTGESLQQDLSAVLARVQPTLILAPSPLDEHPDHRAAGLLAMAVNRSETGGAQLRYWIVHGGEGWPSPRVLMPGIPLTPAPVGQALGFEQLTLEPAEQDHKRLALEAYATQMQVMAPFLLAFVRSSELFAARPTP